MIEEKVLNSPHCQEEEQHLVDDFCVDFVLLYLYDYDSLRNDGAKLHQLRLQGV